MCMDLSIERGWGRSSAEVEDFVMYFSYSTRLWFSQFLLGVTTVSLDGGTTYLIYKIAVLVLNP